MLAGSTVQSMLDGNSVVHVNAGKAVFKQVHVASFAANAPLEDAFAVSRVVIPPAQSQSQRQSQCSDSAGDTRPDDRPFNLVTVLDGHWAPHCSAALAELLPVFIQDAVSVAATSPDHHAASASSTPDNSAISSALAAAFIHCDASLLAYPFSLLPVDFFDKSDADIVSLVSSDSTLRQSVFAALLPAVTGSCALSALLHNDSLLVANTGDCRAVLGSADTTNNNKLLAKDLSHDHNGENLSEVRRLQAEHPDQKDTVIFVNKHDPSNTMRVLGGLMPTRSFGDAKYKWPIHVSHKVDLIVPSIKKSIPMQPDCINPPYITAAPEIIEHKLSPNDRFLVLATDGLYDQLGSQEVVDVVSSLLDNSLPNKTVAPFPPWLSSSESKQLVSHLHPTPVTTCVDNTGVLIENSNEIAGGVNLATSLVRAAMVGSVGGRVSGRRNAGDVMNLVEEAELRAGVEPGDARRIRDDITVIVVVF
ncbi:hypothetical protein HK100_001953 [Physocladia obscura]|uniref:PPM-type phosphatase domain-containing protein n=1 Tax=Physocladia obscura TaxID=109957 RepID=A0AAD5T7D9_9FUNG|nr:hypothetical protein HK100_001953 [Physocladia obscura]